MEVMQVAKFRKCEFFFQIFFYFYLRDKLIYIYIYITKGKNSVQEHYFQCEFRRLRKFAGCEIYVILPYAPKIK